nr:MAG TPA: hypothetical protein [Caudoviricetes sp.]
MSFAPSQKLKSSHVIVTCTSICLIICFPPCFLSGHVFVTSCVYYSHVFVTL